MQLRYGSDAYDGTSEITGHKRYARREYYGQRSFCEYPAVWHVPIYGKSRGSCRDSGGVWNAYAHAMYAGNYRAVGTGKSHRSHRRAARSE